MITFGMGIGLAGTAGTIISLQWVIFPQMGATYITKAFAIVVLGGLGNIHGALLGGLIIGVLEGVVTQCERKDGPDHPFRHDSPHPTAQAYRTL